MDKHQISISASPITLPPSFRLILHLPSTVKHPSSPSSHTTLHLGLGDLHILGVNDSSTIVCLSQGWKGVERREEDASVSVGYRGVFN